MDNSIHRTWKS